MGPFELLDKPRPAVAGRDAAKFLAAVLSQPRVKRLLSSQHFSVDGTLIEAWASIKSFKPKDPPESGDDPQGGRNAPVDFRGERRSNQTHRSTTDPDARLYRKSLPLRKQGGRAWRQNSALSATG